MASANPFDLLGDDDNDDPSQLIAKVVIPKKALDPTQATVQNQQPKQAKLPTKPVPPTQAVRDAKNEVARGGYGRGRGFGRGRGGGGFSRDREVVDNENTYSNNGISGGYNAPEDGDAGKTTERRSYGGPRGPYRGGGGGRRGGFSNDEPVDGERPRRIYDRRSGTGRGNEFKREGAGRGNWGTSTDELNQDTEEVANNDEKNVSTEKPGEEVADASKENAVNEPEEKEPEEKEMTLDEYEKVLEEKRKALLALKAEERKVVVDKEFEAMQPLSSKKDNNDIFIKLGSDKDKRKEIAEKEEKAKKSVSINEFLKPAEGERYYSPGGRRGGRGGRGRGGFSGGSMTYNDAAPSIEDRGEFPILGVK